MLFSNKPLVQKTSDKNIQHPTATTGLDRKSTFYDRILAKEFKEYFQFEYPDEKTKETKQENNLVLKKKRIK